MPRKLSFVIFLDAVNASFTLNSIIYLYVCQITCMLSPLYHPIFSFKLDHNLGGGGGVGVWIGVCREGSETLTLIKDESDEN